MCVCVCACVCVCVCVRVVTHMQFLAARSLCMKFLLLRYSIPLAICRHTSSNSFLAESTCTHTERTMKVYRGFTENYRKITEG